MERPYLVEWAKNSNIDRIQKLTDFSIAIKEYCDLLEEAISELQDSLREEQLDKSRCHDVDEYYRGVE